MGGQPDTQRLVGDIARLGVVASVDLATATCRVRIGEIVTGDIPWLAARAGTARIWSPPSIGEQILLICPEGDTAAGIALPGLYSNAHAAPAATPGSVEIHFDDGTQVGYDPGSKTLVVIVTDGGTMQIEASDGIKLRGPVEIEGKLTVSDDVVAGSVSLQNHRHDKVQAGGAISGKPVP